MILYIQIYFSTITITEEVFEKIWQKLRWYLFNSRVTLMFVMQNCTRAISIITNLLCSSSTVHFSFQNCKRWLMKHLWSLYQTSIFTPLTSKPRLPIGFPRPQNIENIIKLHKLTWNVQDNPKEPSPAYSAEISGMAPSQFSAPKPPPIGKVSRQTINMPSSRKIVKVPEVQCIVLPWRWPCPRRENKAGEWISRYVNADTPEVSRVKESCTGKRERGHEPREREREARRKLFCTPAAFAITKNRPLSLLTPWERVVAGIPEQREGTRVSRAPSSVADRTRHEPQIHETLSHFIEAP